MPQTFAHGEGARLSPAQQAVWTLVQQTYPPGTVFQARDLFPARNATASGNRRTLEALCRKGVLLSAAGKAGVPAWAAAVYYYEQATRP